MLQADTALLIVGAGCALSAIIAAAEWIVVEIRHKITRPSDNGSRGLLLAVHGGRIAGGMTVLIGTTTGRIDLNRIGLVLLLVTACATLVLMTDGYEAADFMHIAAVSCLCARNLAPNLVPASLATILISISLALTYEVAGFAKLFSPAWGTGNALPRIIATRTFGLPIILTKPIPRTAWRLAERFVIAMECTYVVIYLIPAPYLWLLVTFWIIFHLSVAAIMGLNLFWLTYACSYPAVLTTADLLQHHWR